MLSIRQTDRDAIVEILLQIMKSPNKTLTIMLEKMLSNSIYFEGGVQSSWVTWHQLWGANFFLNLNF